jgi:hypothetical protein
LQEGTAFHARRHRTGQLTDGTEIAGAMVTLAAASPFDPDQCGPQPFGP